MASPPAREGEGWIKQDLSTGGFSVWALRAKECGEQLENSRAGATGLCFEVGEAWLTLLRCPCPAARGQAQSRQQAVNPE